jgi:AcrR family transcriptional regulator
VTRDTRERILDATLAAVSAYGLSRVTLDDVAREAGLSRQTVYRYFGTRDALLAATIEREERGFIDRMVTAAYRHEDLRPAMEAAIAEGLSAARAHPLLDRLLATEPEALLPSLLGGANQVLSTAQPVVEELLRTFAPHLGAREVALAAEATSRLLVSYALTPSATDVEDLAGGLADLVVNGVKPPG